MKTSIKGKLQNQIVVQTNINSTFQKYIYYRVESHKTLFLIALGIINIISKIRYKNMIKTGVKKVKKTASLNGRTDFLNCI